MKISKVLSRAADHIEEHGWFQGYFWPADDYLWSDAPYTDGDPCCAIGAVAVVEGVDPVAFDTEAMQFVAGHLAMTTARFTDWNDDPKRTKEEVLAILRAASERAKRLDR